MKLMVGGVPPLAGAGAVFTIGGLVLLVSGRSARRPTLPEVRRAAGVGLLLLVGGQGLATVVLTKLTASLTAVLLASVPLWMAAFGRFHGRRIGRARALRLLVGFGGIAIVLLTSPGAALGGSLIAVVGCGVAAVCWAAGSVRSADKRAMPDDPRIAGAIQLITGGSVLLAIAAASGQLSPSSFHRVTPTSVEAAAFLLFVDSLAGFALYAHLLRAAPLSLVGSYAYATPLVAAAIGIAAFGDRPWPGMGVGAVLVIAAVYREVRETEDPARDRRRRASRASRGRRGT
jgi:drug/metabolite transporter (DMT)-like permease